MILSSTVSLTIYGELSIPRRLLTYDEIQEIVKRTTVLESIRRKRAGVLEHAQREIRVIRYEGDWIHLPRGCATVLREVLEADRIRWDDRRSSSPVTYAATCDWRPHQNEMAEQLSQHQQMIALVATGGGKTRGAFAAMQKIGQRMLVLVPTVDLARQWADEGIACGAFPSVCTGGDWATNSSSSVVISTPETALRNLDKIRGKFGFLCVDEVQSFATWRRMQLIGQIDAKYRLGMTATIPRDHRGRILEMIFGKVEVRYDVEDGVDDGFLMVPEYIPIPTMFQADYVSSDDWEPLVARLVKDAARNDLIVDTVRERCKGLVCLVLSVRIEHLETLDRLFSMRGLRTAMLHGNVSKSDRKHALDLARTGGVDVLLGSTVADQGIDVPGLGAVALAFPGRSESRLLQRIGRCMRASSGKSRPVILDFCDSVGPLSGQAKARARVYKKSFRVSLST